MSAISRFGVFAGVLVVLVACGAEASPAPPPPSAGVPRGDICVLLPGDVILEHLGVAMRDARGTGTSGISYTCSYTLDDTKSGGGAPRLSTALTILPSSKPAVEYLDGAFSGQAGAGPGPYSTLDGLGEAAGFGPLGDETRLVVVTTEGRDVHKLVLEFQDLDVTAGQARPLAERLLAGLRG